MSEEDLRNEIESEVNRMGGYVYPALFLGAFAELGSKRVVFKTYSIVGVKPEGGELEYTESPERAKELFLCAVRACLSEIGRGKTLYWRRYPEVSWCDDKFSVTARFFYGEPQ